jgi:hypothetical protein
LIIVTNFPTQTQISHHKNESTKFDFTRLRLLHGCVSRPRTSSGWRHPELLRLPPPEREEIGDWKEEGKIEEGR